MAVLPRKRSVLRIAVIAGFTLPVLPSPAAPQQTRPLDHEDTYRWSRIDAPTLSPDGRWLAYVIAPWNGDPALVVARADGTAERRYRGSDPSFTRDSRYLAFRVPPVKAVVDSLELEGKKGDDLPGDSLAVVTLVDAFGSDDAEIGVFRDGPIRSFRIPEEGGAWIAYLLAATPESDDGEAAPEGAGEPARPGPETPAAGEVPETHSKAWKTWHEMKDGTPLVLRDLASGRAYRFEDVLDFAVAPSGSALAYATGVKNVAEAGEEGADARTDGVFVVDPGSGESVAALSGRGHYRQLAFDEDGDRLAFVTDRDDWEADRPAWALYRAARGGWAGERIADASTAGMPPGWGVSEKGQLSFSEDGSRLFFGTAPAPPPEPEERLAEDEVRVDVWNWQDDYLQPMQLVQADRERDRSYLAVAHDGASDVVQLATSAVPEVARTREGTERFVLGSTDLPYRQELSWDGRYQDGYAIDVRTGERRRIATRVRGFGGASLSPGGRYAWWWDEVGRDWKVVPMDGSSGERSLTGDLPVAFHDELDDHPQGPPPYGFPVWLEDDTAVLLPDEFDVWRADPSGRSAPRRLTDGRGDRIRHRVLRTDPTEPALPEGSILYSLFAADTKASGYARGRTDRAGAAVLILDDAWFGAPVRARDAEVYVWTRETFVEFPDLRVSGPGFDDGRRLSDVNPQQAEYRWGSAGLVHWLSADGTKLDGILIKPDGFDPARRYPMMVYFYERLSDGLHRYQPPVPNRASIRYSFYASRGYLVFIPDIPYEIGYPGESAIDAVVPGILSLVEQGFVDADRIGVQGHSWGGYQIAYMITRTDIFAAAEAGAPVSNMTSAYGGIRWQTGMSRMFQYERSQSRIGGTLWEARPRYIHNSPVFFADKIHTPLLMLHNDEDGAVPWYQGIEMFVAMRRLGKPAFMLNYNGEPHGLTRRANQEDWAIRMQQFFDHYLMGAPAPRWMAEGVPAVDKGRDLGLELIQSAVTQEGEEGGS